MIDASQIHTLWNATFVAPSLTQQNVNIILFYMLKEVTVNMSTSDIRTTFGIYNYYYIFCNFYRYIFGIFLPNINKHKVYLNLESFINLNKLNNKYKELLTNILGLSV